MFNPTPLARVARELRATVLVGVALSGSIASPVAASEVRVRGRTEFSAIQVLPSESGLRVQGTLLDDLSKPVANARVRLVGVRRDRAPSAEPCAPAPGEAVSDGVLHTDAVGRFCAEVPTDSEGTAVKLVYDGGELLKATTLETSLTRLLSGIELDLGRSMLKLDLGKPEHLIRVATRAGPIAPDVQESLPITLSLERDGKETPIGAPQAPTVGQSALFSVASSKLPAPGPARVTARFTGTRAIAPSSAAALARITAGVTLSLAGDVPAGNPTKGLTVDVAVGSPAGAVPGGWVEARRDGIPVGIGEVKLGSAAVVVTFDEARERAVPLSLAYISREPWWIPGEPLTVDVNVVATAPWQLAPWLAVLLGLLALVLRSWWRPRRDERRAPATRPAELHHGNAEILVVGEEPAGDGWHGRVVDAHDGTPIAQATVRLAIPGFSAASPPLETRTDDVGRFRLQWRDKRVPEGSTLQLESEWHSTLQEPVPRRGRLSVAMVHRRRTLLQRLTKWASRAGAPWHTDRGATPRHVEDQAVRVRREDVAQWARSVELGAFGSEKPDAEFERRVTEKEPRPPTR